MSKDKDTNPKDAVGTKKAPISTVSGVALLEVSACLGMLIPGPVLLEIGLGMLEGARKYGRHNYRVAGVRASVYYDATARHLLAYLSGEDVDPDSGLSHITKALCSTFVLLDAIRFGKCTDDRPPAYTGEFFDFGHPQNTDSVQVKVEEIFTKLIRWWEGGNVADLTDCMADLVILRESQLTDTVTDSRVAPHAPEKWMDKLHLKAIDIIDKYPDPKVPYTNLNKDEDRSVIKNAK